MPPIRKSTLFMVLILAIVNLHFLLFIELFDFNIEYDNHTLKYEYGLENNSDYLNSIDYSLIEEINKHKDQGIWICYARSDTLYFNYLVFWYPK